MLCFFLYSFPYWNAQASNAIIRPGWQLISSKTSSVVWCKEIVAGWELHRELRQKKKITITFKTLRSQIFFLYKETKVVTGISTCWSNEFQDPFFSDRHLLLSVLHCSQWLVISWLKERVKIKLVICIVKVQTAMQWPGKQTCITQHCCLPQTRPMYA